MFATNISISNNIVIKKTTISEFEAMKLVSKYTNIKIPKVYKLIKHNDDECTIHMEYIKGISLSDYLEYISKKEKENIIIQLQNILMQLRKIPNPYDYYVCSANGSPIKDHRIGPDYVGLFKTEFEFNNAIGNKNSQEKNVSVFTHADIKPHNLIKDLNGNIILIDWETGAWLPKYWEYTKSLFSY
jgi:serine/threonine protein kinase